MQFSNKLSTINENWNSLNICGIYYFRLGREVNRGFANEDFKIDFSYKIFMFCDIKSLKSFLLTHTCVSPIMKGA